MELGEEHPAFWAGFRWPIQMVKDVQYLPTLRHLARETNELHSENIYIEKRVWIEFMAFERSTTALCENVVTYNRLLAAEWLMCTMAVDMFVQKSFPHWHRQPIPLSY